MTEISFKTAPEKEPARQYYFIEQGALLRKRKEDELNHPLTYHVTTFGCQMNAKDSEKMRGILDAMGFINCEDERDADLVLFNTCTIRDNANQKFYGHLGSLNDKNHRNKNRITAVCGCMMQERECVENIRKKYRFVNIIFGTHNIYKLAELVCKKLSGEEFVCDIWDKPEEIVEDIPSIRKYPFKSGVNIMYGCNNYCSYCIVPYVRGPERSREAKDIIRECEVLAGEGVKEIMLLGQNVNSYGSGIKDGINFPMLLKEVEQIDGIERIRFMTSHPKDLSDELIEVMKGSAKICRHIHLPLQSGSSRILKAMNRRYTKEQYLELAYKIRNELPDTAITTDIIVGFPGELKEDVDETIDVIRKIRFDGAFTFIYSPRRGTPASYMEQSDPIEVKKEFNRVLEAVNEESKAMALLHTGNIEDVLVDDVNEQDDTLLTGRMSNNMTVHFAGDKNLIGSIVKVRLDECKGFYFNGSLIKAV